MACYASDAVGWFPGDPEAKGEKAIRAVYEGMLGGGHQVPSFTPVSPEWVRQAGPQNQDIETIDEFWKFAKQFSR